ncbi:toxic anion resistance protein [Fusibacter sp. 3D3]|uniref:toxic anion resistance protein n=1 Tax=Fusibacter sp. 3D3 TaxID=1048380 RepID=UPI0008571767|nr:toxic anion resistance protein [Fusibacter sp. 3D3]GAU78827.1 tellurite resistance protein [Fusibacter sp. 3D3]
MEHLTLANQSLTSIDTMTKEITEYEKMSSQEKSKVDKIVADMDLSDSAAVLQFGLQAQSNISNFSNNILNQVRSKDSGAVGEILSNLIVNVKNIEVDQIGGSHGFLGLFDGFKKSAQKFMARYEKIGVQIDKIVDELDKSRMQLLKDITLLDNLYAKNLEYHRELEYYIIAGEKKIEELKNVTIPDLKSKAMESGDPIEAQIVNDYNQILNRFEKKVYDLKLSRAIVLQTGPQVRLIQGNDQVLVEKIQSSILNTIPLWKNQIVIAISLFRQEKALKQQKEVSKTTNELLLKNSELLKQNSIEVAKESEKGIVEIETLKKVNQDLIDTIEETLNIQKEGSEKRKQAEVELKEMEKQLKEKLIEIRE